MVRIGGKGDAAPRQPMIAPDLLNKLRSLNEKQQAAFEAMIDSMINNEKGE